MDSAAVEVGAVDGASEEGEAVTAAAVAWVADSADSGVDSAAAVVVDLDRLPMHNCTFFRRGMRSRRPRTRRARTPHPRIRDRSDICL